MKNTLKTLTLALAAGLLASSSLFAATVTATGTTTLQVVVANEAAITINTGTTTLSTVKTDFSNAYTGTTNITYSVRTTQTTGGGTITVQITSDFSPVGGPTTALGPLTYNCTGAGTGVTPCSGPLTALTASATNVLTFGADTHGNANTASAAWSLPDLPSYKTGTYNATATFTISAT